MGVYPHTRFFSIKRDEDRGVDFHLAVALMLAMCMQLIACQASTQRPYQVSRVSVRVLKPFS